MPRPTPSADHRALLAAVAAAPADDTPRLVLADWLDDHGDPAHAELIRLQCRPGRPPRGSAEAARAADLGGRLAARLGVPPAVRLRWHRGFVRAVAAGLEDFVDHAGRLAGYAPGFKLALVADWDGDYSSGEEFYGPLADCPLLAGCVSLDLSRHCPGGDGLEALTRSPHLGGLRRLAAPSNEAGGDVTAVAHPAFAGLTWLNLADSDSAGGHPAPEEFAALVGSPHLARLEYLDFGTNEQTDESLAALAATPHLTRLRALDLSWSEFTETGVAAFGAAANLPALRVLDLSETFEPWQGRHGDRHLAALADSPLADQLTRLRVAANGVTDAGALALAGSPRRLRFDLLDLSRNPIGPTGRAALRARFGPACVFDPDG